MGLPLLALLILSSPLGSLQARSLRVHDGGSVSIAAEDRAAAERVRWVETADRHAALGVRGGVEDLRRWVSATPPMEIMRAVEWVDSLPLTVDVLKGGGVTLSLRLRGL